MTVKEKIIEILEENEGARNNDLVLIYETLKSYGLPTDIEALKDITATNIFESIRRYRALAQAENPLLRANDRVRKNRTLKEISMRNEMRGL